MGVGAGVGVGVADGCRAAAEVDDVGEPGDATEPDDPVPVQPAAARAAAAAETTSAARPADDQRRWGRPPKAATRRRPVLTRWRRGFLCNRNARSVAGWRVVEIVRSTRLHSGFTSRPDTA
jgi:hypothetical protein